MTDKIKAIQQSADLFRQSPNSGVKSAKYVGDVDTLLNEIELLNQVIDRLSYQLDTVYLDGEWDFDDDDWLDGNECRPFEDEPQGKDDKHE